MIPLEALMGTFKQFMSSFKFPDNFVVLNDIGT